MKDTKKIVKEYENALAKYHAELPAHKKAMKKYLKKKKKLEIKSATRLPVTIHFGDPNIDSGNFSFLVTEQGLEKLLKLANKIGFKLQYLYKPEKLLKPTLEVRTKTDICPF